MRSMLVAIASVLALSAFGCAADFEESSNGEGTESSLSTGAGDRYESANPGTTVEGRADLNDPRTSRFSDPITDKAAGHEPLIVKMQPAGNVDTNTEVSGH